MEEMLTEELLAKALYETLATVLARHGCERAQVGAVEFRPKEWKNVSAKDKSIAREQARLLLARILR